MQNPRARPVAVTKLAIGVLLYSSGKLQEAAGLLREAQEVVRHNKKAKALPEDEMVLMVC
jgi:hypothetical protein